MRMNNRLRDLLFKHIQNIMQSDPDYQKLKDQQKVAEENLTKAAKIVFENYCTKEEQKALAKFNIGLIVNNNPSAKKALMLVKRDDNIYNNTYGSMLYRTDTVQLDLKEIRLPFVALPLRSNHPFWADYEKYETTKDKAPDYLRKKLQPYYTLINKATTLEKIFEIWPEAKDCPNLKQPTSNLPSPINKTLIQEIQADVAKRQIQAEQTQ